MRVALIGRTAMLMQTAELLLAAGYEIPLIVTCKEAPEYKVTSKDFEDLAERIGAKFIHTAQINLVDNLHFVKGVSNLDIAVSVNYSGVIQKEVIDCFRLGILNGHAGDLPRYRGNAPLAWAIINGEQRVGLCIQKMIGGELDSGDIVVREYRDVDDSTSVGELDRWIHARIPTMMLEAVNLLKEDPDYFLERQSTDASLAMRCYPRFPEDGRIEWRNDSRSILRLVKASSEPYAGAYCEYESERLTLWDCKIADDSEVYSAVPGQISNIDMDTGYVTVITGKGKIEIVEISYGDYRGVPGKVIRSIRKRLK